MKTDNIDFSIELLVELKDKMLPFLHISDKEFHNYFVAINNAIAALKTIEDGNYHLKTHLNSVYGKMCYKDTDSAGKIDLKTLYEQTTMYCNLVQKLHTAPLHIEIYEQPDTPIQIYVAWKNKKIHSISYTIKEK